MSWLDLRAGETIDSDGSTISIKQRTTQLLQNTMIQYAGLVLDHSKKS